VPIRALQPSRALELATFHMEETVRDLARLLAFRTDSSDPTTGAQMEACARWLALYLIQVGLDARVLPTHGAPVVIGNWWHAPGKPTLLIYAHYDVQPPGPRSVWTSPPFMPQLRGAKLYARGASDDKGQLFAHVKAMEAHLRAYGRLPLNVTCIFEGEEEIGSPALSRLMRRRPPRADVAVVSDTTILGPEQPAITVGLRGQLAAELKVRGASSDLHSGLFGGSVGNPIQVIGRLLAGLENGAGRVALPGFYDRVRPLSIRERIELRSSGPRDHDLLGVAGTANSWGEAGYSPYERVAIRPALTVNGIYGGHLGAGPKSVIPSMAGAKLSFRLVPDQNPVEVNELLRAYVANHIPPGMSWSLKTQKVEWPILTSSRRPGVRAAAEAYRRGFGRKPALVRSGGSVALVSLLERNLGIPTVLMGFGLLTDRQHGPNEHIRLDVLRRAIYTCINFYSLVAGVSSRRSPTFGTLHETDAPSEQTTFGVKALSDAGYKTVASL